MLAQVVPIRRIRRDTSFWSYKIPPGLNCHPGSLVEIKFHGHPCLGIVWELDNNQDKRAVFIDRVICEKPIIKAPNRRFIEYLSQYGLCSLSTALYQWLPRALRRYPLKTQAHRLLEEYSGNPETIPLSQTLIAVPYNKTGFQSSLTSKYRTPVLSFFTEDLDEKKELTNWLNILEGKIEAGVGRERAIFAPWTNLRHIFLLEPEDVFYYHEQSPYLNLVDAVFALSDIQKSNLNLRSFLPRKAGSLLWGDKVVQPTFSGKFQLADIRREDILNEALINKIKSVLALNKKVIVLYNAKDRLIDYYKDGLRSKQKSPGIESLTRELLKKLNLGAHPGNLIIGTRTILQSTHQNVGLSVVLSLDPLLSHENLADFLQGCADLGHLSSLASPCVIQSKQPEHPFILSLLQNQGESYLADWLQKNLLGNLPPFSTQIVCSAPSEKIAESLVSDLYKKLNLYLEPPWQISHPLQTIYRKEKIIGLIVYCPQQNIRLPAKLRQALLSLPRPWKVQNNPSIFF